jgi:hypothetical protein
MENSSKGLETLIRLATEHWEPTDGGYQGVPYTRDYVNTAQNTMGIYFEDRPLRFTTVFPIDSDADANNPLAIDELDCLSFARWIIRHQEENGFVDLDIVSFQVHIGINFHGIPDIPSVKLLAERMGLPDDFHEKQWGWVIVEITDSAS